MAPAFAVCYPEILFRKKNQYGYPDFYFILLHVTLFFVQVGQSACFYFSLSLISLLYTYCIFAN